MKKRKPLEKIKVQITDVSHFESFWTRGSCTASNDQAKFELIVLMLNEVADRQKEIESDLRDCWHNALK